MEHPTRELSTTTLDCQKRLKGKQHSTSVDIKVASFYGYKVTDVIYKKILNFTKSFNILSWK